MLLSKTKQTQRLEEITEDLKTELRQIINAFREETSVARGYLLLGDNDIPVKVIINIKNLLIDYIEIDSETVKSALMRSS